MCGKINFPGYNKVEWFSVHFVQISHSHLCSIDNIIAQFFVFLYNLPLDKCNHFAYIYTVYFIYNINKVDMLLF